MFVPLSLTSVLLVMNVFFYKLHNWWFYKTLYAEDVEIFDTTWLEVRTSKKCKSCFPFLPKNEKMFVAFSGSILAYFLAVPLDTIRRKMIESVVDGKPLGIIEAAQKIYREGGLPAFWNGGSNEVIIIRIFVSVVVEQITGYY